MTTHVLGDTGVLTGRSLRHIVRSPDTIITTAVTPIALMLLFVYVFGGAINTGSDESYVNYMLPGILLITIASGVAYTAYRLFLDMQGGIFDRFQSMPIARSSVLWAHVLTSLVANLVSVALVIGVALIMGFRTGASVAAWLAVAGILILFTLALTWLAVIAGLSAKTVDGASAFSYPLIFLPFISSAFVPTDSMPGPVAWFAENQPVTSIVNTIRALFAQQPVGSDIWIALAWLVGHLVVAYAFAIAIYRRRISKAAGGRNQNHPKEPRRDTHEEHDGRRVGEPPGDEPTRHGCTTRGPPNRSREGDGRDSRRGLALSGAGDRKSETTRRSRKRPARKRRGPPSGGASRD